MMMLTFVTGVVDAIGYLGLDRVFTGNMTGNIVILAMGVAGADELPVLGPASALVAFAVGAFVTGIALRSSSSLWTLRVTLALTTGASILFALAVVLFVVDGAPSPLVQVGVASLTAATMGEQAYVARSLAVKDLTTVVVTSTLTSFAGDSLVRGGRHAVFNRRITAIAVLFAGAAVGALLLLFGHIWVPMMLAAALTFTVAVYGHRRYRG
ncbi:YoaK family protein [Rhodococcus jostii]|uniref:Uncharacterized membrane protein YoaK, UPF0700 family n=1 Tax=Rhodococcus jostii TaxID=132919 RepID=A0A1H4IT25_RHOJO|nr:YoaK family protein [Rhodococcus jostii]SEB37234.1 Uncharacterized membrane protein YoaK, UPF0700 family [Rhodococcus jostii]